MCIDVIVSSAFYIDTEYCWHSSTVSFSNNVRISILFIVLFIHVRAAYDIKSSAPSPEVNALQASVRFGG